MTDSLGRSSTTLVLPTYRWVLPQAAWRLLLDFLKCESSFCNKVVPIFLPYGWIKLRAIHDAQPEESGQVREGGLVPGRNHR